MLYGQIAILELKNYRYFKRFISLFKCDYDKISCALLTLGDYFQFSKGRYQLGSKNVKSWQNLFHKSSAKNFDATQDCLSRFLTLTENFSDKFLDKIIAEYLAKCERNKNFEWSYYYIKYPVFRPNRYGKYDWENFEDEPYKFIALWTDKKWSENAYNPFLKNLEEKFNLCQYDAYDERLVVDESFYIKSENSAYVIYELETNREIARLDVNQRHGVDTEDRIEKFLHWVR